MKTIDDTYARLQCLARFVLAETLVNPWRSTAHEERQPLEDAYDLLRTPLCDGQLPATPNERRTLGKYLEMWSFAECMNATWRMESALTLAWALGLREGPLPFDRQTVDLELLDAVTTDANFSTRASMRSNDELEELRRDSDEWWRRARHARSFYEALQTQQSTLSKKKQDGLQVLIGEVPELFGKPYVRLTGKEHSVAHSIASERHTALTWLLDDVEWDALPLRD